MTRKHIVQNFAIAVIVPTILFVIAFLGVKGLDLKPTGKLVDSNSVWVESLAANISLKPYLRFDSIQNVCDSVTTKHHKKFGRNYYVELGWIFPYSELKGLRAYTIENGKFRYGDAFFCDGGYLGDSISLAKIEGSGNYVLISKNASIFLGKASFDLRDNFLDELVSNRNFAAATLIFIVSMVILIASFFCCPPNSECYVPAVIVAIILGVMWGCCLNTLHGQFKLYDFPIIIQLYVALCWLGCIIALFFVLLPYTKEKNNSKTKEA